MDDNESNIGHSSNKKWIVLAIVSLVVLGLLGWFVAKDSSNQQASNNDAKNKTAQTENAEQKPVVTSIFEAQFDQRSRTILFKTNTTTVENEEATAAIERSIAEFAKINKDAKFDIQGSVLSDSKTNAGTELAKQRAEVIKQRLVAKGIDAAAISISTADNYKGKDKAAQAEYERSVVITAK